MRLLKWFLLALTVAGLAVDASLHLYLAAAYTGVRAWVSEATLFRLEAALAGLAALVVLVRRGRLSAALAGSVAGGGLVLLLVYRYVDVGRLGPLPNMYEPFWFPDKVITAVAEGVAALSAVALATLGGLREQ